MHRSFSRAGITVSYAACNKNNDHADNQLVGTWSAYAKRDSIYSKPVGTAQTMYSTLTRFYQKFIFRAYGTCTLVDSTGTPGFVAELPYKLAGDKFILGLPGGYDTAVIAISGSEFTLTDVRDDSEYYWKSVVFYNRQ